MEFCRYLCRSSPIRQKCSKTTRVHEDGQGCGIIEKIIVKERTSLEFHLKNGLRFEEHYTLKRGRDLF
jgi:hypothetical protein